MTHIKTAASAAPQQHALPDYEEQQQAEDQHRRLREKSHLFSGVHQPTKRQCVFQSSPESVQWFRPSSAWFTAAPLPKQTPKRGRDGVDDLCKSLKRLRTEDEEVVEEVVEEKKAVQKEKAVQREHSPSTALVLSRPRTIRLELPRTPSPSYSLPPPGTFPVVLYKGPPAPPRRLAYEEDPPDIEEFTPMLSRENRTLRVSPSFTIELVDDDEPEPAHRPRPVLDDDFEPGPGPSFEDEEGPRVVELDEDDETEAVTGQLRDTVMSDDDDDL